MSVPAELIGSSMNLQTLLQGIVDAPAIEISGISTDSRRLDDGYVFFAIAGVQSHGLDFKEQAVQAGVAAIVYEPRTAEEADLVSAVPMIALPELHRHVGEIANRWFNSPSASLDVIAVTGTNGKTTVAMMLANCLRFLGRRTGYVGTLGKGIDELSDGDGLTSPSCIEMHAALSEFRDQNATYAAIEVSSHALTQARIDGVRIDSAIFTNLSRDHLDYHGDMQHYFNAKAQLFSESSLQHRIINIDSDYGVELASRYDRSVVVVSTQADRDSDTRPFVFVREVVSDEDGSQVRVASSWGDANFRIRMPGDFNVENAVLVLAVLLSYGVAIADAIASLEQVSAPAGRMQRVEMDDALGMPSVYIDFAHTPEGLEKALQAVRQHSDAELWCVFGCGGDRDRGKRPQMGEVAAGLADYAVVTNDNPRSENPATIIDDILSGMNAGTIVIEDRAAAIAHAIRACSSSATVVIAGKGHERAQQRILRRRIGLMAERRQIGDEGRGRHAGRHVLRRNRHHQHRHVMPCLGLNGEHQRAENL